MSVDSINIVHISDIHLSEQLMAAPSGQLFKELRGHYPPAFIALDNWLKNNAWDILVISGDLSRAGGHDSFIMLRTWLESTIPLGATSIGLNLNSHNNHEKRYIVVPGNHDRFNGDPLLGVFSQRSLDNYHKEFAPVQVSTVIRHHVRGVTVALHLFDSSSNLGGVALGEVEDSALAPRHLSQSEINIAVLHHHIAQPPKHARDRSMELLNCSDVASFMFATPFHAVLFGHTHQCYADVVSAGLVSHMANRRRETRVLLRRKIPECIVRSRVWALVEGFLKKGNNEGGDTSLSGVSYERKEAKNGQHPTFEKHFEYLFMLACVDDTVKSPAEFDNIKAFYSHLDELSSRSKINESISELKKRRMLLSMAPSCCQADAKKRLGINRLQFDYESDKVTRIHVEKLMFDGNRFVNRKGKPKVYAV